MKYLSNIDLNQNELQNTVIQNLASAPSSPREGQVYYNTATKHEYYWNGTTWVQSDGQSAGSVNSVSGSGLIQSSGGTDPVISMIDIATASFIGRITAGTGTPEVLSKTQALSILNVEDGAEVNDPTNLSLGTRTATTMPLASSTGTGVDLVAATTSLAGLLTATDKTKLNGIATGANNYTHPSYTAFTLDIDSTPLTGAYVISDLDFLVTSDVSGHVTGASGTISTRQLTLANLGFTGAANANYYVHPTTSGNKHIPSGGASGNILNWSADGTAVWGTNAPAWANITSKPSSTVANIDDAVSKRHTQNTDTGTTSATFQLQSGSSGVKLKNTSGTFEVRNAADNDYASLKCLNLDVMGTMTTINSNEVNIGDAEILLNSDITLSSQNSDGGIAIKRLMADNTTRKDAKLIYNASTDKWQQVFGAVAGTLSTRDIPGKYSTTVGNGSLTSITVTHGLNTRDAVVLLRQTNSPYAQVIPDIEFTTTNSLTLKFSTAPTANEFTCTVIG